MCLSPNIRLTGANRSRGEISLEAVGGSGHAQAKCAVQAGAGLGAEL